MTPAIEPRKGFLAKFSYPLGVLIAILLGILLGILIPGSSPSYPECPGHDTVLVAGDSVLLYGQELPVAGPITGIPEFHDCQKLLVVEGGQISYGPLVGLFAADTLRFLGDTLIPNAAGALEPRSLGALTDTPYSFTDTLIANTQAGLGAEDAISLVIIWNQGAPYVPLGIEEGFSCLYVRRSAAPPVTWSAWMVHAGATIESADEACTKVYRSQEDPPGVPLRVRPTDHNPVRVPPVARWDFDAGGRVHTIGLKCDVFTWCEVYGHSSIVSANPVAAASPALPGWHRVSSVKGWFDDQVLAREESGNLVPSETHGAIFPVPNLGTLEMDDFEGNWVLVAKGYLSQDDPGYFQKLTLTNTGLGPPNPTNGTAIYLCQGPRKPYLPGNPWCDGVPASLDCDQPWWGRFVSEDGTTVYRCIKRVDHTDDATLHGIEIPAVARWRWVNEDEKLWIRCAVGCCVPD